jgi:hypothetical protein
VRGFAGHGKGRHEQVVDRLAVGQHLAELLRLCGESLVGQRFHALFERVDCGDLRLIGANAAFVGRSEEFAGEPTKTDHSMVLSDLRHIRSASLPTAEIRRLGAEQRETALDARLRDR